MKQTKLKRRKKHFNNAVPLNAVGIKLDKSVFEFDLFWSVRDGKKLPIDSIIFIYSQYLSTKNMKALVMLFGKKRVLKILRRSTNEHERACKINIAIVNNTIKRKYTAYDFAPCII
ncbi:hypothetical protein [Sulfurimonas sp.]|uniref:hypothetical protein n=1 Tax=Sulfurimonas sp. TaxID=2022749 RepID=UPI002AB2E5B8|nr:hypothetical protein [Sulfurimonas sp.]